MGCGASTGSSAGPTEAITWEQVKCSEACKAHMQTGGIVPEVAHALVTKLGVRDMHDLTPTIITPEMIKSLGLKPVGERRVTLLINNHEPVLGKPAMASGSGGVAAGVPAGGVTKTLTVTMSATRQVVNTAPAGYEPESSESMLGNLKALMHDKKKLTALAQTSIKVGVVFLQKIGNVLPFPGSSAAALLGQVLEHVGGALANKDNLKRLMERCTDLLGLVVGRLEPVPGSDELKATQSYKSLISRFTDLLKDVVQYCSSYADRNFLMRMITHSGDAQDYEDMASRLTELTVEATFAVTVDIHDASLEIQKQIQTLTVELQNGMKYVDHSAALRAFVDSTPGGVEAVLNNEQLLEQAIQSMDVGQHITMQVMRQGFLRAAADNNKGPHRVIRQKDLREMWHRFCSGPEVDWEYWWSIFPDDLTEIVDEQTYKQLCDVFSTTDAQMAFQIAVERRKPDVLSVDELKLSFPADVALVDRIKQLTLSTPSIGTAGPATASTRTPAAILAVTPAAPAVDKQKCALPEVCDFYVGRQEEADKLCGMIVDSSTRSMCLVAAGGLGKSSLALDIGWKLWRGGHVAGGAFMVNLRGACTLAQQEQRLCAAVGLTYDDTAHARLLAYLGALTNKRLLLVMDNAEDCLDEKNSSAETFAGFMKEVLDTSPATVLLFTSRLHWPSKILRLPRFHEHTVPALDTQPLFTLVRELCPADAISDTEVKQVVAACGGSPLLTRLVADACAHGHLTTQDVLKTAGSSSSHLTLSLQALPQRQRQQLATLSIFPYTLSEDDAAAVLQCSSERAASLLSSLYAHNLLCYDSGSAMYYMHMAVKQQASALSSKEHMQQGRMAFVKHMITQLVSWAGMYQTTSFSLAMSLTRQASASLDEVWNVLNSDTALRKQCTGLVTDAATQKVLDLLSSVGMVSRTKPLWGSALKEFDGQPGTDAQRAALLSMLAIWASRKEAEGQYREVLLLRKKALDPGHILIAESTNALAGCLRQAGQHANALTLCQEALDMRERLLGEDHPETLMNMNEYAECLRCQGDYSQAEPFYNKALGKMKVVLGPDHPAAVVVLNNYAECQRSQGKYREAEVLFKEALALKKHVLGPEHPSTIIGMNNLAETIRNQGRHDESEVMYRDTLQLKKKVLGATHSSTITGINNLAENLRCQGRYKEAEPMYKEALDLKKQTMGAENPSTITGINNLAECIRSQGRYVEAEPMFREALDLKRKVLGQDHPSTLTGIHNLGSCLRSLEQWDHAERFFKEAYDLRLKRLGKDHPDTSNTANCLAELQRARPK